VPTLPPYLIEPIFQQFEDLLPERRTDHPLNATARASPRGSSSRSWCRFWSSALAYERIADAACSESLLRRRRDEWIELGVMERLRRICLEAYDRLIGLELSELAVDGCTTKAPCGGEKAGKSPVDRGKRRVKRSMAVDACGIPLGTVSASANRDDSPLLLPTLGAASEALGSSVPQEASVHLETAGTTRSSPASVLRSWC
jgi:hypothetical protein